MPEKEPIKWTSYLACAYAEGFGEGENATQKEQIEAFAYLIKTKEAWSLQGWYGRAANTLIQRGIVDKAGNISWETLEDIEN